MAFRLITMSAFMARLAALALFLLWNFHAGLHLMHGHCHDHGDDAGSTYNLAADEEDCASCHVSVAPGLVGHAPLSLEAPEADCEFGRDAELLAARLYSCADGRGPPAVFA